MPAPYSVTPIIPSEVPDTLEQPTDQEVVDAMLYLNDAVPPRFYNGQATVNVNQFGIALRALLITLYTQVGWVVTQTEVQITESVPAEKFFVFRKS